MSDMMLTEDDLKHALSTMFESVYEGFGGSPSTWATQQAEAALAEADATLLEQTLLVYADQLADAPSDAHGYRELRELLTTADWVPDEVKTVVALTSSAPPPEPEQSDAAKAYEAMKQMTLYHMREAQERINQKVADQLLLYGNGYTWAPHTDNSQFTTLGGHTA